MPAETTPRLARGIAAITLVIMATSVLGIGPAAARAHDAWSLDCKGNSSAGASWTWLLDGVPISGASQAVICGGTESLTGTVTRPSSANGLVVEIRAGTDSSALTVTFDPSRSVGVNGGAHYNAFGEICPPDSRTCFAFHFQEDAHFSLEA